jgi:hypothetical protein
MTLGIKIGMIMIMVIGLKIKLFSVRMLIIAYALFLLLPIPCVMRAQNDSTQWEKTRARIVKEIAIPIPTLEQILHNNNINFRCPKQFVLDSITECFSPSFRVSYNLGGCMFYNLTSKDGQFIAFIREANFLNTSNIESNTAHLQQIRNDFVALNEYFPYNDKELITMNDIHKYVKYYSATFARQMFNADTVISYSIRYEHKPFRNRYMECSRIIIQKNNRPLVQLLCFYTTKGYKKQKGYLKDLKKTFWYNE